MLLHPMFSVGLQASRYDCLACAPDKAEDAPEGLADLARLHGLGRVGYVQFGHGGLQAVAVLVRKRQTWYMRSKFREEVLQLIPLDTSRVRTNAGSNVGMIANVTDNTDSHMAAGLLDYDAMRPFLLHAGEAKPFALDASLIERNSPVQDLVANFAENCGQACTLDKGSKLRTWQAH